MNETITRARYEQMTDDLFQKIDSLLDIDLKALGIKGVDNLVLSGAFCKTPKIHNLLSTKFPNIENIYGVENSEELITVGNVISLCKQILDS